MFWELCDDDKYETDWDDGMDLEQILCPSNPGHQRGGKRTTSLKVVLPKSPVPDVLWAHDCIIQDSVRRLFRDAGFTGFETHPVKSRFQRKTAERPPLLWELQITGWGGMASPESGMALTYQCPDCGKLKYSGPSKPASIIDASQWDGSDFFMVWPLPRYIFVTDRVAQLVVERRLTGVLLRKPDEIKPFDGASPGRLHSWMPEARAHELGDPLGIY